MPSVLGKRKSPTASRATPAVRAPAPAPAPAPVPATERDANADADTDSIQDIFRRHFEGQFKPLAGSATTKRASQATTPQKTTRAAKHADDSDAASDSADSDWAGLSDDDDDAADGHTDATPAVQVVDYSGGASAADGPGAAMLLTKQERRAYVSSRPLQAWEDDDDDRKKNKNGKNGKNGAAADDFQDAPALLANDLALQRLLAESHLLSGGLAPAAARSAGASAAARTKAFADGRRRLRATDLRVQAAAARGVSAYDSAAAASHAALRSRSDPSRSIYTQAKMPMAMRKGITAAANAREDKRRREARESGVVLERPALAAASAKSAARRRHRAVDAPAVGRLRGSELRLRDSDVRAIEGRRPGPGYMKHKKRR